MNVPLLAKSRTNGDTTPPAITLVGHTDCVLRAIHALFGRQGSPTRLGMSWLRFFGLGEADFDRFLLNLRVAAACHDWGKANDGFQDAVIHKEEQVIRHEHLSGLLLADLVANQDILTWLRNAGVDEVVLIAAVISHHVKAGSKGEHGIGAFVGKRELLNLRSDHADFTAIWKKIQAEVGSSCPKSLAFETRWRKENIKSKRLAMSGLLEKGTATLRDDPIRRRWVGAVRAGSIVADSVGSAVVRMDRGEAETDDSTIDRWVQDCFSTVLTGNDIWTKIIKERIEDLRSRNRWNDAKGFAIGDQRGFNEFQVEVACQGPRVLLTAPCGSGKTLAAWSWIKAELDQKPAARVLFLYPTRATATEGFRDYVSWAPESDAGLLSGTADYELDGMFTTPDDAGDPRQGRKYRSEARLFALGHWKKRIFSATADQFFPFMQYGYGPLCLLPLLAESVLVVDEVHSFDKSMFSTLKRFLKAFPEIPVLCMTATLPVERRNDLVEGCGLKSYPETPPADLVEDSGHPRYRIEWIEREQARTMVRKALDDRKRVLWVANRVSDCQATFHDFYDGEWVGPGNVKVICYHSRFKLEDRKKQHQDLIYAFQDAVKDGASPQAILGATTQVCEMSLDLDAEILVTEVAPIASLIQRMGRCNCDSTKIKTRPIVGRVYVIRPEPGQEKPYEKKALDVAETFVNKITDRDISQDELEAAYKACDPQESEPTKLCPFLDSGPYAEARVESFRETDEFTVPCVLDYDVTKVQTEIAAKRSIDGFIVPVPRYLAGEPGPDASRLPRWLSIADGTRYGKLIGFDDRPRPVSEGGRAS